MRKQCVQCVALRAQCVIAFASLRLCVARVRIRLVIKKQVELYSRCLDCSQQGDLLACAGNNNTTLHYKYLFLICSFFIYYFIA